MSELYINGKKIEIVSNINSISIDNNSDLNDIPNINISKEQTASFEVTCERNDILSLVYSRKVSNNWLKMHGGVMSRKRSILR